MPYKRVLPDSNNFLVIWTENQMPQWEEFIGIKRAIEGYRRLRLFHGDNCRLVKVLVNNGEEI